MIVKACSPLNSLVNAMKLTTLSISQILLLVNVQLKLYNEHALLKNFQSNWPLSVFRSTVLASLLAYCTKYNNCISWVWNNFRLCKFLQRGKRHYGEQYFSLWLIAWIVVADVVCGRLCHNFRIFTVICRVRHEIAECSAYARVMWHPYSHSVD